MDYASLLQAENLIKINTYSCLNHKQPIIMYCYDRSCKNTGFICGKCLKENNEIKSTITIIDFFQELEIYLLKEKDKKDHILSLHSSTTNKFIDLLINFKNEMNILIDSSIEKLKESHQRIQKIIESNISLFEYVKNKLDNNTEYSNLLEIDKTFKDLGVIFDVVGQKFNFQEGNLLENIIPNELTILMNKIKKIQEEVDLKINNHNHAGLVKVEESLSNLTLCKYMEFNLESSIIEEKEINECCKSFKKKVNDKKFYCFISNTDLDFTMKMTWKVKIISLPKNWLCMGILPRTAFQERNSWKTLVGLLGYNCDRYFFNPENDIIKKYKAMKGSEISCVFDGVNRNFTISCDKPHFVYEIKNIKVQNYGIFFNFFYKSEIIYKIESS